MAPKTSDQATAAIQSCPSPRRAMARSALRRSVIKLLRRPPSRRRSGTRRAPRATARGCVIRVTPTWASTWVSSSIEPDTSHSTTEPSTTTLLTPANPDRSGTGPSSWARRRKAANPRSTSRWPVSMMRPARSMATRSQTASTSLSTCDDSSTVWPRLVGFAHAGPEDLLHEGIQSRGRLVQQEQVRSGGEGRHQQDLLAVPVAGGAHLLVRHQLEAVDQLVAVRGSST